MDHVQEEMRRFIVSVCYQARAWVTRSSARPHSSNEIADGLRAYAYRQALILAKHATNACRLWGTSYTSFLSLPPNVSSILSGLGDPLHAAANGLCEERDSGSDVPEVD